MRAIERFGPPPLVAGRFGPPAARALSGLAVPALGLFAVGLIAIGLSGLVALAFGRLWGHHFVVSGGPGVQYSTARCADFLRFHPQFKGAGDPVAQCQAAADAHHFDEVVGYRLDAGVLGLVVLLALAVVVWRKPRLRSSRLPDVVVPAVGSALFGTAAAGLLVLALMPIAFARSAAGAGEYLSAGIIASAFALAYVAGFGRTLRRHPA